MARIHTFLVSCWPYFRIYNIKCPRNEWHFQKDLYQIETSVKQRPSCHLFLCGCELILYAVRVMSQTAFHLDREEKIIPSLNKRNENGFEVFSFSFERWWLLNQVLCMKRINQNNLLWHTFCLFFFTLNFVFWKIMHKTTKAGVILNTIIIVLTGNGLTTKLNYRLMQFSDSIFVFNAKFSKFTRSTQSF